MANLFRALASLLPVRGREGVVSVLLVFHVEITTELVPVVLDSPPAKQGLHVPGTHQRIAVPSELETLAPDIVLLLAWNHAPEIIDREHAFIARGGRFLTPRLELLP